jgi:hypothetical protein
MYVRFSRLLYVEYTYAHNICLRRNLFDAPLFFSCSCLPFLFVSDASMSRLHCEKERNEKINHKIVVGDSAVIFRNMYARRYMHIL